MIELPAASARLGELDPPLLSICIPTHGRRDQVTSLVRSLMTAPGPFEIVVHVDGPSDGDLESLQEIQDHRLLVTVGPNQGRAGAIKTAVRNARGRYLMLFDDDDVLYPEGLKRVLTDCAVGAAPAYVYQLESATGQLVGDRFPVARTNFLALRADYRVRGDKKEVVRRDILLPAIETPGASRRVPTSLYWSRLALVHEVHCDNSVIGQKRYAKDGMSAQVHRLRRDNPEPMALLAAVQLRGFVLGRYRSPGFAVRALARWLWFSSRRVAQAKRHQRARV